MSLSGNLRVIVLYYTKVGQLAVINDVGVL